MLYRFEVKTLSRKQGDSLFARTNYITGERIRDEQLGRAYSHKREDVAFSEIFLPDAVPDNYRELQTLISAMDAAEKRVDARTAREFIGSLPNELPLEAQIGIVSEFVEENFVDRGLCAIASIHTGINPDDPRKNNPHVHIIVSTRQIGAEGFLPKKDRSLDSDENVKAWRKSWEETQNRAYARAGLKKRVSCLSLEVQRGYGPSKKHDLPRRGLEWQKAIRQKAKELNRPVEREKVPSREPTLTRSR